MRKGIKVLFAKGFMLAIIICALVSKNPFAGDNGETVVYAAQTLEQYTAKTLKSLKKVYKNYKKTYYTTKEYEKLTSKYEEGVKAIEACTLKSDVKATYAEYNEILTGIKPSILINYQAKMEKIVVNTYNSLISKNNYSSLNLRRLNTIKDEAIEKIYAQKTKVMAKNVKDRAVDSFNRVVISKNISGSSENITTSDYITVKQIEAKIKELCKKYPSFTEDEIRIIVSTANMDYVKDEDIFTVFNVTTIDELIGKAAKLDELFDEMIEYCKKECLAATYMREMGSIPLRSVVKYREGERQYDTMPKINEIFINEVFKKQSEYCFKLTNNIVKEADFDSTKPDPGSYASVELLALFYGRYSPLESFKDFETIFIRTNVLEFDDQKLDNTGAGYFLNRFTIGVLSSLGSDIAFNNYYFDESRHDVNCYVKDYVNPVITRADRMN